MISEISVLCKYWGNLTGGVKTSCYLIEKIGYNRKYEFKTLKKNGFWSLINLWLKVFFDKNIFYCFDHYAVFPILFGKRVVFYYHGNFDGCFTLSKGLKYAVFYLCYKLIVRHAEIILLCSEFSKGFVKSTKTQPIVVYPFFTYEHTVLPVRRELDLSQNVRFLMVGAVDRRKYKFLFNYIENVNVCLDIIGRVTDNIDLKKYQTNECVQFLGFQDNINFSNYDVLLMLSDAENVPSAIVEAVRSGLFVMSRNVGGVSELLNDSVGMIMSDSAIIDVLEGRNLASVQFDNQNYKFLSARKFEKIGITAVKSALLEGTK
ncbi:glycosyltransferase [Amylibacter sp.]|nr:glycosyltransferase [Amylibacter sp.]